MISVDEFRVRRRLLGVAAVAAAAGAFPWLPVGSATAPVATYALLPPAAGAGLAGRVPVAVARQVIAQARQDLERVPHFMPVVHTEGLLDGEGNRLASRRAQEDWRQACLQALAFRLGGGQEHRQCAERYLGSWLGGGYAPSFNPIDETDLPALLFSCDLLQDGLQPSQADAVRELALALAHGYLAEPVRVGKPTSAKNNWHSHRVKLATAGAFLSGEVQLVARARQAFERHVLNNIDAQGQVYDFLQRDALHYVVYSLEPLLQAAAMAAAHGHDWFNSPAIDDRLRKALARLELYALGRRQHEEYVHTTVEFDRRRAQAGVAGFGGVWQPREAAGVYWLAARFEPRFLPVVQMLSPAPWFQALYAYPV